MERRAFITKSALALIASGIGVGAGARRGVLSGTDTRIDTVSPAIRRNKPTLAFVLYNNMTPLDMIGPAAVLSGGDLQVEFVAHDLQPIRGEQPFVQFCPTTTFDQLTHVDILCVTGTGNPYAHLHDTKMLDWMNKVGSKAEWVTSVCTGSILLAAAGLMKGYRATTHWSMMDDLAPFGAIPVDERVVIDRNRISGGGVTAGIDFGLTLCDTLSGRARAEFAQLLIQYDPHPPFHSGTPKTAAETVTADARRRVFERVESETPDWKQRVQESAKRTQQYPPI